jgi:hypothetical protein
VAIYLFYNSTADKALLIIFKEVIINQETCSMTFLKLSYLLKNLSLFNLVRVLKAGLRKVFPERGDHRSPEPELNFCLKVIQNSLAKLF